MTFVSNLPMFYPRLSEKLSFKLFLLHSQAATQHPTNSKSSLISNTASIKVTAPPGGGLTAPALSPISSLPNNSFQGHHDCKEDAIVILLNENPRTSCLAVYLPVLASTALAFRKLTESGYRLNRVAKLQIGWLSFFSLVIIANKQLTTSYPYSLQECISTFM